MATTKMKLTHKPYASLSLGDELGFANPRQESGLDKESLAGLAASIEVDGVLNALHVMPVKRGKKTHYVVVNGSRRYRAIGKLIKNGRANGLAKNVPVKVLTIDDMDEARWLSIIDNLQREGLSSFELAQEFAARRAKDPGLTLAQLGKRIGKSTAWVSRLLTAHKEAGPELRAAWASGALPNDDVQNLAKLEPKKQAKEVAKVVGLRTNGTGDAKAAKKAGTAAKAAARQVAKAAKASAAPSKPRKAPVKNTGAMVAAAESYLKKAKKADKYVRGFCHGIQLMAGVRGAGEIDPDLATFMKKHSMLGTDAKKGK